MPALKTTPRSNTGFTILELLVVLAILGLTAGLVVPMLSGLDNIKAATAADQIVSTLVLAQTWSVAGRSDCQVVFDSSADKFELQDETGTVMPDPTKQMPAGSDSDEYLYRVSYPDSRSLNTVTIDSVDFDGTQAISFDRLGAPRSGLIADGPTALSTGTIEISVGDDRMKISVEPITGQVNVTEIN